MCGSLQVEVLENCSLPLLGEFLLRRCPLQCVCKIRAAAHLSKIKLGIDYMHPKQRT
jgi:hypothetical protein